MTDIKGFTLTPHISNSFSSWLSVRLISFQFLVAIVVASSDSNSAYCDLSEQSTEHVVLLP